MQPSLPATDTQEAAAIARTLRYPPSAARVLPLLKHLLQDMDVSTFRIADAIRLDPGIAARVLHAANSVIYNRGERCTSVAAAVNMIGLENIYEMVANAVAEQVLVIPLAAYSLEAEEFWLRSVTTAIAAEQIADRRELDHNVAYTLGLLSGIGMVAIDQWIRVSQANVALFKRDFPRDYSDSERVLLGCTNADVGALVLQSWDFPPEMSLPVRWQYNPWDSRGHRQLSAMLFCAKWVSAQACRTDGQTAAPPDSRALAAINLSPQQLTPLVRDVRTRLREVQRQLDFQPLEAA